MFRNRSLRGVVLGTVALALAAVLVPAPTAVAIPPFPIVDDTTGTPGELNEAWDRARSAGSTTRAAPTPGTGGCG